MLRAKKPKTMRDAFIEQLYIRMLKNENIFFLCADFGSPVLDKLRNKFSNRFLNVGIAEQNLINVATGLALEGFTVYAYAISPFLTMRAFEQSRNNLSLLSQTKEINVNLVGVGAGLSYDVSGPSHHSLEDISLMGLLPNFIVLSPSDYALAADYVDFTINVKKPKYLRFDAKPLPLIYDNVGKQYLEKGFCELRKGREACLVATGYMTHQALRAAEALKKDRIDCGVLDVFLLKPLNGKAIFNLLKKYKCVVTMEEAFINKAGLDTAILHILSKRQHKVVFRNLGFQDKYVFTLGGREHIHKLHGLDVSGIARVVKKALA
jgi:transketolase